MSSRNKMNETERNVKVGLGNGGARGVRECEKRVLGKIGVILWVERLGKYGWEWGKRVGRLGWDSGAKKWDEWEG